MKITDKPVNREIFGKKQTGKKCPVNWYFFGDF